MAPVLIEPQLVYVSPPTDTRTCRRTGYHIAWQLVVKPQVLCSAVLAHAGVSCCDICNTAYCSNTMWHTWLRPRRHSNLMIPKLIRRQGRSELRCGMVSSTGKDEVAREQTRPSHSFIYVIGQSMKTYERLAWANCTPQGQLYCTKVQILVHGSPWPWGRKMSMCHA